MHATERRRIREASAARRPDQSAPAAGVAPSDRPVRPPGPPFLHPPPRHVAESRYHGVRDEECGANVRLRALVSVSPMSHCRALLPAPAVCVESRSVGTAPFAVVKLQIPSDAVPTDENERERSEWWRAKKWAYEVLGRLFHRFGNPSQLPSTMQAENSAFAAHFVELYVSNQQWLRKKCQYQISSFFMERISWYGVVPSSLARVRPAPPCALVSTACIKPKSTWTLLELHVQLLVKSFVLPQLSFTAGQQHLWKSDPLDYVRNTTNKSPSLSLALLRLRETRGKPRATVAPQHAPHVEILCGPSTNPDTMSGVFTQEVRRFGPCHPGADSAKVTLQTSEGYKTLTVSWAATFISSGNTTASFIAETPSRPTPASRASVRWKATRMRSPGASRARRALFTATTRQTLPTLRAMSSPTEPSDGTDFMPYVNRISSTLFTGLTKLKEAGVKYVLIDNSGNRSGYIYAGAVALWSLIPNDMYPAFLSCATQSSPARSPLLMDPAPPPAVSPTAPQLQNAQPRSSMRTGKS
ncbi:hypothetical protein B0H14DRAFT_3450379 [Mycena olivaceomarginata]|nr:hypothetical protein B0H14DRAFT_3450379 [Mycena olivaceomarginata]